MTNNPVRRALTGGVSLVALLCLSWPIVVAQDITVQSVSAPSSGGLSGASSAQYQVAVQLEPSIADELVRLLPTGEVTVVLRTGENR